MGFIQTQIGHELCVLGVSALKHYLKKPHAVTIKKNCIEDFLNNVESSFVNSIELDDEWVVLILK